MKEINVLLKEKDIKYIIKIIKKEKSTKRNIEIIDNLEYKLIQMNPSKNWYSIEAAKKARLKDPAWSRNHSSITYDSKNYVDKSTLDQ